MAAPVDQRRIYKHIFYVFRLWGQNKTNRICESYNCAALVPLYILGGCDSITLMADPAAIVHCEGLLTTRNRFKVGL